PGNRDRTLREQCFSFKTEMSKSDAEYFTRLGWRKRRLYHYRNVQHLRGELGI
ncbi:MAG: hypothetical protein ACJAXU_002044, partial [Paracoccaceae bacterium]